ncbi:MAG TPA: hypothetical protein GXX20_06275 [Clostridiaceae bacterium]|nr:hypothetical protein [Clostridiaceae bacterium]
MKLDGCPAESNPKEFDEFIRIYNKAKVSKKAVDTTYERRSSVIMLY